jgi:hypothetical protein
MKTVSVDIQGFNLKIKSYKWEFYPKEISTYDGCCLENYLLKPSTPFSELSSINKKQVRYDEEKIHGIRYSDGAEIGDSVGDRRASGCAASRELRITCVAFGIRNHPCGWIAERHGAYRPALPAFGAVEEPEDLPLPLPFCRGRETPRHLAR